MTKRPTKKQLRQQLNQDIEDFLDHGGAVHEFQRGESALINGKLDDRRTGFEQPRQERTPLEAEMQAVDARKKPVKPSSEKKSHRPRKKVIYDDFGEPVREVWLD